MQMQFFPQFMAVCVDERCSKVLRVFQVEEEGGYHNEGSSPSHKKQKL